MVYSGNAKLRMNMFVGLLLLVGRSGIPGSRYKLYLSKLVSMLSSADLMVSRISLVLGSSEASVPKAQQGQSIYGDMLSSTVRDRTQFRDLLFAIRHFLNCSLDIQQISIIDLPAGVWASGSGDGPIPDETALHLFNRIAPLVEPLVLIDDGSRTTRMVCPILPVIAKQSPMLAADLKVPQWYHSDVLCNNGCSWDAPRY